MIEQAPNRHTKGHWRVENPPATAQSSARDGPEIWADGMMLAKIAGIAPFDYANARLMAASPQLLTAARAALDYLAKYNNPFEGEAWELGHRLSAAIGVATDPDYPR